VISVVVPACNEGRVIGRLLDRLVSSAAPGELDVVVVANGCTDDTADVAAGFGSPVRVLTVGAASKPDALAIGDRATRGFPRVFVDADVELGTEDLRALRDALQRPGILAAAPERELPMAGRPWPVRWWYDVWVRLPEVRRGLFGRGVIAFGEAGHARIADLQRVLADDLAISLAFAPEERAVVPEARSVVHPPKTFADLLRRRVRTVVGIAQLGRTAGAPDAGPARTTPSDLLAMVRKDPRLAPRVAFFMVMAVAARMLARRAVRRNDYSTWLRDESSRQ
jgi:glycosyltransferase involved in cell wall biosynthesis